MSIASGTRFGPYEILAPLGSGGMGEVYRAKDTRLDRTVAIKVLPSHVASNPDARQRFEREARAVSSLSHPHICTLYDVGQKDDVAFLVMEHIEGETLAERLTKGALPNELVLRSGIEIAAALDAAHRHGIVHRDLKPGNIMLTKSGVKLLDFGLARQGAGGAAEVMAASGVFPDSPTATRQKGLTAEGTILGTPQYMAPEQLEGKPADVRTDIFALGLVLYEMATGRKAFEGKSQASLIAAILTSDPPPPSTIQPLAPPELDRVVKTCLAKDPEERRQTAHDVKLDLKWIAEAGSRAGVAIGAQPGLAAGEQAATVARVGRREWIAWGAAAVGVVGLAIALPLVFSSLRRPTPDGHPLRFNIAAPETWKLEPDLALSPDGRQLVFAATSEGKIHLWIRMLDSLEARPLPGTEDASLPFWSPDGRSVGFFAGGKLKRIDVALGAVQTLGEARDGRGGSWNRDGDILFSPDPASPLLRVSASGGTATSVTALDVRENEFSHRWPHFLPDGRHFIYMARALGVTEPIWIGSLDSKDRHRLLAADSGVIYAPPGYLLFIRDRALFAQKFDASALRLGGEPLLLAAGVTQVGETGATGYGPFSASENGLLAYRKDIGFATELVWFDRHGVRIGQIGPAADYSDPALSPDGTRLALERATAESQSVDIYLVDLSRESFSRFTFQNAPELLPVWSLDGRQIIYAANVSGPFDLFRKASSGAADEEVLLKSAAHKFPDCVSPDGRYLVYESTDPKTKIDLWALPMSGEPKPRPLIQTPFNEGHAQISPDGRWMAYVSDESGSSEIYLQNFPDRGGKWQVSTAGGDQPTWRHDGRELFYLAPDGGLMVVAVKQGLTLETGVPQQLFRTSLVGLNVTKGLRNNYTVTPDGRRFLVVSPIEGGPSSPITVVSNWTADLKN